MQIGPYTLSSPILLAPMAGITDKPFRQLCRSMGAGLVVSEMVTSEPHLLKSRKTRLRMDHQGDTAPISVQIAGTDPAKMANAAKFNVAQGAHIIDINMGCPAKKVCNVAAGSALMKNEKHVAAILHAVVEAVDVPVTLKIRTGWSRENKNAPTIAHIAEDSGVKMLSIHGRTREDAYKGEAEYETIALIKQQTNIPIVANGDITSAQKAHWIMQYTNADAIMLGRAAQGNPWIFREINHFLNTHKNRSQPDKQEIMNTIQHHLTELYHFYGEQRGAQIARKHIIWYTQKHSSKNDEQNREFRKHINRIKEASHQLRDVIAFFNDALIIKNISRSFAA